MGAGALGMASAYHVQRESPSKSVLVVDRYGDVGQGNTGRSNAMFRNTFTSPDNQVLSDSSISFYLHLQEEMGIDLGLERVGYLWLMTEEQLSRSERHEAAMEKNHIELRRYAREALVSMLPGLATGFGPSDEEAAILGLPEIKGALFGPKCGRLDPLKLTKFYHDEFVRLGGRVSFDSEARRLVLEPRVKLDIPGEPLVWQESRVGGVEIGGRMDGIVQTETVVMAAGAWNNELLSPLGIDGHTRVKKRQLFSLSAKGDERMTRLLHTKGFNDIEVMPMVILPKAGVHLKAVRTAEEFWIGCEDNINRAYLDHPDHDLSAYRAEPDFFELGVYPVLKGYFPQFRGKRPAAMWAGLYSYNTSDYLPFVVPQNGVILVGGDSGSGIMKGDALGRIVSALYREGEGAEAELFGGAPYQASRLGFKKREVEREEWTL